MKKQTLLTILAVITAMVSIAAMSAFAGCKTDESGEHEHTFMRVWSSDAEGHWHKATCEHTEEKGDYAPHVDVEQPYDVCDVCGYKMEHKHRYEENWSYDAENHWHNSTCNDVADDGREAHAWGRAVFMEPTCEEDGYNLYTCSVCGATKTEPTPNSPALGHAIGAEIVPDVPATCSKEGVKAHYECSVCHEIFKKTDDVDDNGEPVYEKMTHEEYAIEIDEDAHDWDNGVETTPATCTTPGVMTYTCINNPEHIKTGEIPMTPHEWNADGKCIHCGADRLYRILPDEEQTNSNFTLLEMGRYPQSQEKDAEKLAELNEKYPETPTLENANGWTEDNEYMPIDADAKFWYKDVDLDGDGKFDYRGGYFNKYSYYYKEYVNAGTPEVSIITHYYQEEAGFLINTVYWFKWEPIIWRKLQKQVTGIPQIDNEPEDTTTATIISDKILDLKIFDDDYCLYEYSDIRKFLNNDFFNSAFTEREKECILNTLLNDDLKAELQAKVDGEEYTVNSRISDNVFLLSSDEIKNKFKISFTDLSFLLNTNELQDGASWDYPQKIVESYPVDKETLLPKPTGPLKVTEEDLLRQIYKETDYVIARDAKNGFTISGSKKTYSGYGEYWTRQISPPYSTCGRSYGGGTIYKPYEQYKGVLPAMQIIV